MVLANKGDSNVLMVCQIWSKNTEKLCVIYRVPGLATLGWQLCWFDPLLKMVGSKKKKKKKKNLAKIT